MPGHSTYMRQTAAALRRRTYVCQVTAHNEVYNRPSLLATFQCHIAALLTGTLLNCVHGFGMPRGVSPTSGKIGQYALFFLDLVLDGKASCLAIGTNRHVPGNAGA